MKATRNERGFTLIEMLTVIGILGVLAYLTLTSLAVQRANAANKSAITSLGNARIALDAAMAEPDAVYPSVSIIQTSQGPISDPDAAQLLPAFQVTHKTAFTYFHDPACDNASCTTDEIIVKHCYGSSFALFSRYGDGTEVYLDQIPGAGCS